MRPNSNDLLGLCLAVYVHRGGISMTLYTSITGFNGGFDGGDKQDYRVDVT